MGYVRFYTDVSTTTQFFFKATLLQQVNDLLQSIYNHLNKGDALVLELEATIKPTEKELSELQRKIRNMEHVEEITQDLQRLKKKLAWSWVYDVDRQLKEQNLKIEKLKDRIPRCQAKIDSRHVSYKQLYMTLMVKSVSF